MIISFSAVLISLIIDLSILMSRHELKGKKGVALLSSKDYLSSTFISYALFMLS